MNDSASMRIRIDAEVSGAVRGLQQVSKQLDAIVPGGKQVSQILQRIQFGLLQIVQGTARNAFVSVTSGMKNMVSAGMQVAETLEAAEVGFESILAPGQDVKALLLDIQKNAVKTPFDVDDLTASTQKLALITKNGAQAEQTILDLGAAVAAAGRGNAELNRMAVNLQQIGLSSKATGRDLKEFTNAGVDLVGLVAEYSIAFKQTGKDASEAMDWLKTISNPYEVIAEVLHKAANENGRFADIYEKGATTIKQANENMQDSMAVFSYRVLEQSKILDKAKNIFSEFQNNLFLDDTFTANTAAAIKHLIDMVNELDVIRPIIDGIKKAVSAFASGQFDNVIVFFRELFGEIKKFSGLQTIINVFKVFLDLFSDNHTASEVGNVARQIGTLVRYFLELKFVMGVTTYLANFASVLMKIGMGLTEIVPALKAASSAFLQLFSHMNKWTIIAGVVIGAIVLISKYGDQLGDLFSDLGKFFADLPKSIVGVVKDFISIGYNIMAGLWNGLVQGAQAVFNAIKDLGRQIVSGFKSVLGIHSPSTLMRDEVGRYIDEGIAEGIRQNYKSIASATEEVLEELVKLQQNYVKELSDFGALDLVQTVKVYKDFAQLYKKGTKARIEMDDKVHDTEVSIIKEMISLIETYNKKWDKAYQSAKDYYDMFEYTQTTLTRSTASVIEGLQRQNDNLTKYYDNLKKMSEMGFDEDFMSYIYEQGLDAAAEVNGLADATAEEIEKINQLWATRGQVAGQIATLNTKKLKEETLEELDYLQSGLDTKVLNFYESGQYLDYNFATGIYDWMPTIEEAMMRVEANTKKKAQEAGEVATDYADIVSGALGDIDTSEPIAQLEKLNIEMFDTHDLASLMKNILGSIPWPIWAAGALLFVTKLKGVWEQLRGLTPEVKAIKEAFGGFGKSSASLDLVVAKLSNVIKAIYAMRDAMFSISNYDSVFRQAMSGMYPTVNTEVKKIINLIDLAKSQGVISTKDATKLIGDILINGFDNMSKESQDTFTKMQKAMGQTVTKTADVVGDSIEKVEQGATASIKRLDSTMKALPAQATGNYSKTFDKIVNDTEKTAGKIESTFVNTKDGVVEVMGKISDGTSDAYDDILGATIVTTDNMGSRWSRLGDKMMNGLHGAQSALGTLGTALQGINPKVATFLNQANDTLSNGLFKIESTGVTHIGGLVDKFKTGFGKLSGASDTAKAEFGKIGKGMKDSFDSMKGTAAAGFDGIKTTMDTKIVQTGKSAVSKVSGVFGKVSSAIVNTLSGLGNVLAAPIQGLGNIIVQLLDAMGGLIKGAFASILDTIGGLINAFFQTVTTLLKTLLGGIGEAFAALLKPLSDPKLLIGVGAIVGLAVALVALAAACATFANVQWGDMAKAGVAVVALGVIAAAFGAASELIIVGAVAMAAAGVALAIAGVGILALFGSLNLASQLAKGIDKNALLDAAWAVVQLGLALTVGIITNLTGALSGAFATAIAVELVAITAGLSLASLMAKGVDKNALLDAIWAVDQLGLALTVGLISNLIGALSGVFATAIAVELVAITAGLALASLMAKGVDKEALMNAIWTVDQLGLALTVGTISNIVGALSGVFATAIAVELVAITAGLSLASKMAGDIDKNALLDAIWAVDQLGLALTAGTISNIIGAVSGAFATAISVELLAIVAALSKATQIAKEIDVDQIDNIQKVIDKLKGIDFGGALSNLGKLASSAELAGIAAAVAAMVGNVKKICENLAELEDITDGNITPQLEKVKSICKQVGELMDGIETGGWFNSESKAAEELEKIANSVAIVIEKVTTILENLREVDHLVGADKTFNDYSDTIKGILKAVGQLMDDIENNSALKKESKAAEALGSIAENVSKVLENVIKICENLEKAESMMPDDTEVATRVAEVQAIVKAVSTLVDGADAGGWGNNKTDKASKISDLANSVDNVLQKVVSMVENVKKLAGMNYTPDQVVKEVENVNKIVQALANIGIDKDEKDLNAIKEKAAKISEFSSSFDSILGSVQGMVDKVKALQDKGYDVEATKKVVENVEAIIGRLASVSITQGEDDLSSLANKAGSLKSAAENFDSILGSVRGIVDKLAQLKKDGYNVGESHDWHDVHYLIDQLNQIISKLGGVRIDSSQNALSKLADKSAKLKDAASNLNEITKTVTEMVNNLKKFDDAMKSTGIGIDTMVEGLNNIIMKILGDGKDNGGIKLPTTSQITEDNITALGFVQQAVAKLAEISTTLLTVQDASAAILNAEAIVKFIVDTMAQLPSKLEQFKNDMQMQGGAYADAFINGWKSKYGDGEQAAHDMQGRFWNALESKMQDEYFQGAAFAGKLIEGALSRMDEFAQVGADFQGKFWNAIESKMGDEKAQGAKLAGQVLDGLNGRLSEFGTAGSNLQGSLWNAVEKKMQDEYWQGNALAGKMLEGLNSRNGEYPGVGANVVAGIAGGISNNVWRINNAMGQISSAAINKLKQLLDIHSPSRVMAELGGYVAEGFADGITDALGEVENAGEALAEAVMDGYNDTIEPINLTAFEARSLASADEMGIGGTTNRNTTITQTNNIYNDMDTAKALSDIAWAVSRS